MRTLALLCLALALGLAGARLCTGLVYGEDAPVTYLVLRTPGSPQERKATPTAPVQRRLVLDEEEPDLTYGGAYRALMRATPLFEVVLLGGAIASVRKGRSMRQRRGLRA